VKGRKLPSKAALGLIIGGDLLLLIVGWFMLIGPQRATATSIVQATAAAEAQLVELSRPVVPTKPAAAPQQPVIKTADLYSLDKAMPTDPDQPGLLLELDQVARSAGVDISAISFGTPTVSGTDPFSTDAINISFSGDFYSITDMLYRLRTLVTVRNGALVTSGRLFSVDTVGLAPSGTEGTKLNATALVTAYIYVDPAIAAAAAAAAAPPVAASTDTTSTSTDTTATTTTPAPSSDVAPAP
jgi:Tfp pilus assembly protein PilO